MRALLILACCSVLAVLVSTDTSTATSTDTSTATSTDNITSTSTDTSTATSTDTITSTSTDSSTATSTDTITSTSTDSSTATSTDTITATSTDTSTASSTATITATPTATITATSTATMHSTYNCNRMDDCRNGATCSANGTCACSNTYNTYNCQYDTSGTNCNNTICKNGGTCLNDTVCACPYGFYGNLCDIHQVDIICNGSTSVFKITLPSEFDGIVQVYPKTNGAVCNLTEPASGGPKQYSATFDHSPNGTQNCPSSNLDIYTLNGNTNYTARFLVHYKKLLTTSVDELYTLTCTHAGGNVTVSKEITDIQVNISDLDPVTKAEEIRPVGMALRRNGAELTGALYVGQQFEVVISVDNTDAFANVLIESCAANDTKTIPTTYPIFDNGCPTSESKTFVGEQVGSQNNKSITIKAFKFRDSQTLGIVCNVRLCKEGDNTCAAPENCASVRLDSQGKRKKRDADDKSEETLSAVVTVLIPGETVTVTDDNTNASATIGTCFAQTSIVSLVAILGALMHTLW
ncbi:uncharacterized protein LOC127867841 isoform X2 [Dreissena polymorpha]|uniref:uncharacterized protein LOC127867841 isoform X2 n=1 Tax=Dreissena polymorpha TaxID=45954 RepID=UPI002264459B|nr:uncharacterized protein LOC127867841 isoform X2 [Dreissena polymorpha]